MSGRDSLDDVPSKPFRSNPSGEGLMSLSIDQSSFTNPTLEGAALSALRDIHHEFEKASVNLDALHSGPTRTADQRAALIRVYSEAVERIIGSVRELSA